MGLFDKLFTGLSKTRKNMVELEELLKWYSLSREAYVNRT